MLPRQHLTIKFTLVLGNTKLGEIANINLTPGISCRPGAPCLKRMLCVEWKL